jgi:DNA-binding response OmpR family regulator
MQPETAAGQVSGERGETQTDGDEATVLVVDDNKAIADTYAAFLREEYTVRTAYSGEEALTAVDATVDVVLLDRRMPDVSGDEVLAEIRSRALDPRVVMLTAVDPDFDILDMPFDAYVVKPVGRGDVVGVVAEMCQRAGYDDEFRRFLSLASKRAALEREKDDAELADSEEYDRIEDRLASLRERLGIDTEDVEGIFGGTVPDIAPGDAVTAATSE